MMARFYQCDRCRCLKHKDEIKSLTTMFQRPYLNFRVKHLCNDCAKLFEINFTNFFKNQEK